MTILEYWYLFFEAMLVYICPCLQKEIAFEKINYDEIKFNEKYF